MKKREIIDFLVKITGVNKEDTKKVYNAIFDLIKQQLNVN